MTAQTPLLSQDPAYLGAYRLHGRLGAGGMGVVYLGEREDGQVVAIKVIRPEFAADPDYRARFEREATLARRVDRFVARVLDADVEGSRPYIVTEYVEGTTLHAQVRRCPLTASQLLSTAIGVASALVAIHDAEFAHRDLKPSNVLLSRYGPVVIDFGIARALDQLTELTVGGGQPGTPAFMAPEQLTGDQVTTATDVFAWGGTVLYAATGRFPFGDADGRAGLEHRILNEEPELDALDPPLRGLVAAAMAKRPGDRPGARALVDGLLGGSRPTLYDTQVEAARRVRESWESPPSPNGDRGHTGPDRSNTRPAHGGDWTRAEPVLHSAWPVAPTVEEARRVLYGFADRSWLTRRPDVAGVGEVVDVSEIRWRAEWVEERREEERRSRPGKVEPDRIRADLDLPEYDGPLARLPSPIEVTWRDQTWEGLRRGSIAVQPCDDCTNGKVRCDDCQGHGSIRCPPTKPCRACPRDDSLCSHCGGRGFLACPRCDGLGQRRCQSQGCNGSGQVRCPHCEGYRRRTWFVTGTITHRFAATRRFDTKPDPDGPCHLVAEFPGEVDWSAIPSRYHDGLSDDIDRFQREPSPDEIARRFLISVAPRFQVAYDDGTTRRSAVVVGDDPDWSLDSIDETSLAVRARRARALLVRAWARLRAARYEDSRTSLAARVGLAVVLVAALGGGALLANHFLVP